ncbi:hypothetical protein HUU62_04865 [Rhodoferax sp. 4810]|nr:hypothetical protein [Rhodoferax jenense]
MKRPKIRERIRSIAFDLLEQEPQGLRYSDLLRKIKQTGPELNPNTVNNSIWNLEVVEPERVYKPVKGLFRLLKYKESLSTETTAELPVSQQQSKVREEVFYPLFANWLKNDLEEVTQAIALGGNAFRDRWGTPDVIGKAESRRSDVIKGPTSIVSAEIKSDLAGLVTGFGQACAYKLFSHKSYLVIPSQTPEDELARIDSLCQIFGIGLVTFNAKSAAVPEFRLVVRATKHEPDLFYTNRYVSHVEKELFS